jgi:hypothetical protein
MRDEGPTGIVFQPGPVHFQSNARSKLPPATWTGGKDNKERILISRKNIMATIATAIQK